jgi:hypothetical protein
VPASLESAITAYGRAAKAKLSAAAVRGEPEDQLRSPVEHLLADLAELCGLDRSELVVVGESSLAEIKTRPDFAVSYRNVLAGFVELKAPGKGADPRSYRTTHDREQWRKLQALPNLIYSDGGSFSLWRDGTLVGSVVHLDGDIASSGSALRAPDRLLSLFHDFLTWSPTPPTTARQLADVSARLCRLLRAEVAEQLEQGDEVLTQLYAEWRSLLFPDADHNQFADGYAQAVTFGLLLARAQGIGMENGVGPVAAQLAASRSLIGTALRILTDPVVAGGTLATSVATMARMLSSVDWPTISKGEPDVWLYFYEDFLAEYDSQLRRRTGSYYTPVPVVELMARLVDEALRTRFDLPEGLGNDAVTLVDPAMGTGTFLLEVVRAIGAGIAADQGEGAVAAGVEAALRRLIGFEIQVGPFAVAQLRLLAELAELGVRNPPDGALRTYVTDTLGNPFSEEQVIQGYVYEPIARSRRTANQIKRDEPVLVVLGNPPYKERSHGQGGWIESGNPDVQQEAPLADFYPPREWGVGAHVKHLYNPYVYFWRWATWKVFDRHPEADRGVVCFITVNGFLDGPGFQQMRRYLRRTGDAIWVIDCSPEGHQPATRTRVFQGVQQPVCIVLVARDGSTPADEPAPVRFRSLPAGQRDAKFAAFREISLTGPDWLDCPADWRAPFLPPGSERWQSFPSLDDLLRWSGSGTMPGRTWVIAPDRETLGERWHALTTARAEDKADLFSEHRRDRRVDTVLSDGLPGFRPTHTPIGREDGPCPAPVRIGYRSFDQQWIIPDKRLINQPNPTLWSLRSASQVYLTAPHDTAPTTGPAATLTPQVPDLHHYKGSFGGRAYPLWLDPDGGTPNLVPGLRDHLEAVYRAPVAATDLFAYLAAVLSHPGFTATFAGDLSTPGIRVPVTADRSLFERAVRLGERVLWLHCYGQRFHDDRAGRPHRAPRLPATAAPKVLGSHPIPSEPDRMPDSLSYDAAKGELIVGEGRISNVTTAVRGYQVSGVNVLDKWFSYRRRTRVRPVLGGRRVSALNSIQLDHWSNEYTTDLINLLNVLGLLVELESAQADLLAEIVSGLLVTVDGLTAAGVLPVAPDARRVTRTPEATRDPDALW